MRIIHPQYQEFYDRRTGIQFLPTVVGDRLLACAEVTDEAVRADLLRRGFEVHPDDIKPTDLEEPAVADPPAEAPAQPKRARR